MADSRYNKEGLVEYPKTEEFSPPITGVLRYFACGHLPEPLKSMSQQFQDLAYSLARSSSNDETVVALRKLLEAKDAAVRSLLP